jgi:16S rRNA (uracil1498-N3)-methyltransferase
MQRYFVNELGELSQDDIFHIIKVMRFKVNDQFELVTKNAVFTMKIDQISPFLYSEVSRRDIIKNDYNITLLYCLPKGDKMELVIQKATELGVDEIIGFISSRTIVRLDAKDRVKKIARYQKIIKEASEQCHRDTVPNFNGIYDFKELNKFKFDYCLIADEDESGNTSNLYNTILNIKKGSSIAILVGAEGGFSRDEVNYAKTLGFNPVSLGKRILRSETAAIASLSIISFLLERE